MKILELTGLLEARQFELDHLRCELEQSKETIAELEGQIKMQFKSPRSKVEEVNVLAL